MRLNMETLFKYKYLKDFCFASWHDFEYINIDNKYVYNFNSFYRWPYEMRNYLICG